MTTTDAPAALRRELEEPSAIVPLRPAAGPGPELAIIVPTLNERGNIAPLIERPGRLFVGTDWEVVFVDDNSADGIADYLRVRGRDDRRIRCIQRVGRRGLSSACIEGLLSTSARCIAVIDGDLQHDEALLPSILDVLKKNLMQGYFPSPNCLIDFRSRYSGNSKLGWLTTFEYLVLLAEKMTGGYLSWRSVVWGR